MKKVSIVRIIGQKIAKIKNCSHKAFLKLGVCVSPILTKISSTHRVTQCWAQRSIAVDQRVKSRYKLKDEKSEKIKRTVQEDMRAICEIQDIMWDQHWGHFIVKPIVGVRWPVCRVLDSKWDKNRGGTWDGDEREAWRPSCWK